MNTLVTLYQTLEQRRNFEPETSYTARLFKAGEDEIVKKIGEEAVEVILAVKGQGEERIISEIADLTYHTLVLMVSKGITLEQIAAELEQRRK